MIQRLDKGGKIKMGDFIYDSSDMTTPVSQVEKSITLPSYRKRTKTIPYYPFNPGRNKWLTDGGGFGDAPLQLNEGEELTPETYEDIFKRQIDSFLLCKRKRIQPKTTVLEEFENLSKLQV